MIARCKKKFANLASLMKKIKSTSYPKEKIKILLLENISQAAVKLFHDNGYSQIEHHKEAWDETMLLKKIGTVHLLGIRSKTQLTAPVLNKANRLLTAGCFCIGTNQVNIEFALNHGIAVFNSPYSNTRSVAELVIGHCIYLMRRIASKNEAAHKGVWLKDSSSSFEVRGKTLGIIGYGHIGSQVSVLAESLGMRIMFHDAVSKLALGNARQVNNLGDLLKQSDVITLHVPSLPLTRRMIGQEEIRKMKKGAMLINLSRGDVVDLNALRSGIESGQIGGAALDVFPKEPESNSEIFKTPLQGLPNVILTPHIGGSTTEAQEQIGLDVAGKMISFLETGSSMGSLSIPELSLPVMHQAHRLLHIHRNVPGVLSEINGILSSMKVNVLGQYLKTNETVGYVVLDIDKKSSAKALEALRRVKNTIKVRSLY